MQDSSIHAPFCCFNRGREPSSWPWPMCEHSAVRVTSCLHCFCPGLEVNPQTASSVSPVRPSSQIINRAASITTSGMGATSWKSTAATGFAWYRLCGCQSSSWVFAQAFRESMQSRGLSKESVFINLTLQQRFCSCTNTIRPNKIRYACVLLVFALLVGGFGVNFPSGAKRRSSQ